MAAVTIGTTGATWGLTAETGLLVQTVSAKVTRDKNEVRDEIGEVALVSYYNPLQKYSVNGVSIGTTGVPAAAPGVALTIANSNTANGAPTGSIYTDDIEIAKGNIEFRKFTANATQYKF